MQNEAEQKKQKVTNGILRKNDEWIKTR